jgi:hypothetical protein
MGLARLGGSGRSCGELLTCRCGGVPSAETAHAFVRTSADNWRACGGAAKP